MPNDVHQFPPPSHNEPVAPVPPAHDYTYPAYGEHDFAKPPGAKKKTGLVIVIAIIGVILAICGCGAFGVFYFLSASDEDSGTAQITSETLSEEDLRLQEWLAWAPVVTEMLPATPSEKLSFVEEGLDIVGPDLRYEESVMWTGVYDAAEDWYYADMFLVRATNPASDKVSAGIDLFIQSDLMIAEDIPFEADAGDVVTTIADGTRELLYYRLWGSERYPLKSQVGVALWETIGEDWPNAVVMRITDDESDEDLVEVRLTKWRLYAIDAVSPYVRATYQLSGDEWLLLGWEYALPEEMPID